MPNPEGAVLPMPLPGNSNPDNSPSRRDWRTEPAITLTADIAAAKKQIDPNRKDDDVEVLEHESRLQARSRMTEEQEEYRGRKSPIELLRRGASRWWKYTVHSTGTYAKEKQQAQRMMVEAGVQMKAMPYDFLRNVRKVAQEQISQELAGRSLFRRAGTNLKEISRQVAIASTALDHQEVAVVKHLRRAAFLSETERTRVMETTNTAADDVALRRFLQGGANHDLLTQYKSVLTGDFQASEGLAKRLADNMGDDAIRVGIGERKHEVMGHPEAKLTFTPALEKFFKEEVIAPLLREGLTRDTISEDTLLEVRTKVQEAFFRKDFVAWRDQQSEAVQASLRESLSYGTDIIPLVQEVLLPQAKDIRRDLLSSNNLEQYVNRIVLQANVGTLKAGEQGMLNENVLERSLSRSIDNRRVNEMYTRIRADATAGRERFGTTAEQHSGANRELWVVPNAYSEPAATRANLFFGTARFVPSLVPWAAAFGSGLGLYLGQQALRKSSNLIVPFVGGALVNAGFRTEQERGRRQRELEQVGIETARGYEHADDESRRRIEMEALMPPRVSIIDQITRLRTLRTDLQTGTNPEQQMRELIGSLADVRARRRLMDQNQNLELYSTAENQDMNAMRTELQQAQAEAIATLTRYMGSHRDEYNALARQVGMDQYIALTDGETLTQFRRMFEGGVPPVPAGRRRVPNTPQGLVGMRMENITRGTALDARYIAALNETRMANQDQSIEGRRAASIDAERAALARTFGTSLAFGIAGGAAGWGISRGLQWVGNELGDGWNIITHHVNTIPPPGNGEPNYNAEPLQKIPGTNIQTRLPQGWELHPEANNSFEIINKHEHITQQFHFNLDKTGIPAATDIKHVNDFLLTHGFEARVQTFPQTGLDANFAQAIEQAPMKSITVNGQPVYVPSPEHIHFPPTITGDRFTVSVDSGVPGVPAGPHDFQIHPDRSITAADANDKLRYLVGKITLPQNPTDQLHQFDKLSLEDLHKLNTYELKGDYSVVDHHIDYPGMPKGMYAGNELYGHRFTGFNMADAKHPQWMQDRGFISYGKAITSGTVFPEGAGVHGLTDDTTFGMEGRVHDLVTNYGYTQHDAEQLVAQWQANPPQDEVVQRMLDNPLNKGLLVDTGHGMALPPDHMAVVVHTPNKDVVVPYTYRVINGNKVLGAWLPEDLLTAQGTPNANVLRIDYDFVTEKQTGHLEKFADYFAQHHSSDNLEFHQIAATQWPVDNSGAITFHTETPPPIIEIDVAPKPEPVVAPFEHRYSDWYGFAEPPRRPLEAPRRTQVPELTPSAREAGRSTVDYYGRSYVGNLSEEQRQFYRNRMSETLRSNAGANLDFSTEAAEYFRTQDPEYRRELERYLSQPGMSEPMSDHCDSIVCIPVYTLGEGQIIEHSLNQYLLQIDKSRNKQAVDPSHFELILFLNHPKHPTPGKDPEQSRTGLEAKLGHPIEDGAEARVRAGTPEQYDTEEVVRQFMLKHPELKIRVMRKEFEQRPEWGKIIKPLYDVALLRANSRSGGAAGKDPIIITNDIDVEDMSPTYIRDLAQALDLNGRKAKHDPSQRKVDGLVSKYDMPNHGYGQYPGFLAAYRFNQFIEAQFRKSPSASFLTHGRCTALRGSAYAAIGGANPNTDAGADIEMGRALAFARNGQRTVDYFNRAWLHTNPRRELDTWKQGHTLTSAWDKWADMDVYGKDWKADLRPQQPGDMDKTFLENDINAKVHGWGLNPHSAEVKRALSLLGLVDSDYGVVNGNVVIYRLDSVVANVKAFADEERWKIAEEKKKEAMAHQPVIMIETNQAVEYLDYEEFDEIYEDIYMDKEYPWQPDPSNPTPTIIDLGGHIGLSVLYWKSLAPNARITVVEANPDTSAVLERNVARNHLTDVQVVKGAVSSQDGTVPLYRSKNGTDFHWGDFVGGVPVDPTKFERVDVPAVKLSDRITGPVDLLKIDIEGSECEVLKEAESKLSQVKEIMMEFHNDPANPANSFQETVDILRRQGYQFEVREWNQLMDLSTLDLSWKRFFTISAKRA